MLPPLGVPHGRGALDRRHPEEARLPRQQGGRTGFHSGPLAPPCTSPHFYKAHPPPCQASAGASFRYQLAHGHLPTSEGPCMTSGPSHPATGSWSLCTSPSGYFSPCDYLAAFNKMMTSSLPVGSLRALFVLGLCGPWCQS